MLGTLITSKTRIKLLLKFFLNANNTGYLKNLEQEFEDSSNGIRLELNKFEEAGLLTSSSQGNKKIFQANTSHPLFKDIHNIILKYTGIDQILESVIERLGNVNSVYLVGSLAKGLDAKVIDIILVGDINKEYLLSLIEKAEPVIGKKIKYILYQPDEFLLHKKEILLEVHLLIWSK
jgi:predicted nucleotidyltransferase